MRRRRLKLRFNKKLLFIPLVLIFALVLGVIISNQPEKDAIASENFPTHYYDYKGNGLKDGVYQASAQGFNDELTVEMTVANGIIEDFRIVSHNETKAVTKTALTKIPYEIVKEQSVNVDIVSSATETSAAILQAARDCIRQAGGNPNDYN